MASFLEDLVGILGPAIKIGGGVAKVVNAVSGDGGTTTTTSTRNIPPPSAGELSALSSSLNFAQSGAVPTVPQPNQEQSILSHNFNRINAAQFGLQIPDRTPIPSFGPTGAASTGPGAGAATPFDFISGSASTSGTTTSSRGGGSSALGLGAIASAGAGLLKFSVDMLSRVCLLP